jgi:hypothetical protein
MPTITTDVEFEAFCSECNAGICNNLTYRQSHNRGAHQFTVDPCDKCIKNAKQDGYDAGYQAGLRDAECLLEHKE